MTAKKVDGCVSGEGDTNVVPAGPDAYIQGFPLNTIIQNPLKTNFTIFKTLVPPIRTTVGSESTKHKIDDPPIKKKKVPKLPMPDEGSTARSVTNWSECSEVTPHLNLPPLSSIINHETINNYHSDFVKDFEIAEQEAEKTKTMIKELRAEINSYSQKDKLSPEEIGKLEENKEKLGRSVRKFEEIAEKITRSSEITENEGFTSEDPKSPMSRKEEPVMRNPEKAEEATTDIDAKTSHSDVSLSSLRHSKLKEEIQMMAAALESDLAACELSMMEPTPRSIISESCASASGAKTLPLEESLSPLLMQTSPVNSQRVDSELVASMSNRLSESYHMQEMLATENKTLEDNRFKLQEELMLKETETERLERKLEALDTELRILKRENSTLEEKIRSKCGTTVISSTAANALTTELNGLHNEIKKFKTELSFLHTEREELMLKRLTVHNSMQSCLAVENNRRKKSNSESDKGNLSEALEEVRVLSETNRQLQIELEKALEQNKETSDYKAMLKKTRVELKQLEETSAKREEQIKELTEKINYGQEESDELRIQLEDKTVEIQEYRNKYLLAQQRVEELLRELDQKENDLQMAQSEAASEIRALKIQYQDRIADADHMGSMLKEMQSKLQESQQKKILLERGVDDLKKEMLHLKDTNAILQKTIENERTSRYVDSTERQKLEATIVEFEAKYNELMNEKSEFQSKIVRLEEAMMFMEQRNNEKVKEAAEFSKQLETVRQEAARQLNRCKERGDSTRRALQVQVADLERELAAARAAVKTAHKERDEVRHKLQTQINSLTETLEEGQSRWKGLQAHVATLQNSLHPNSSLRNFPVTPS